MSDEKIVAFCCHNCGNKIPINPDTLEWRVLPTAYRPSMHRESASIYCPECAEFTRVDKVIF